MVPDRCQNTVKFHLRQRSVRTECVLELHKITNGRTVRLKISATAMSLRYVAALLYAVDVTRVEPVDEKHVWFEYSLVDSSTLNYKLLGIHNIRIYKEALT